MNMKLRWACVALIALCLPALAAPAAAQVFTGRIDITVTDATGAVLPGVTVTIEGPQNAVSVTDDKGEAHFLNLAPGTYALSARIEGFNEYVNRNVPVAAGAGVPLKVSMTVGGVSAQVDVTGSTPVINPKRTTTTTNVTYDELQQVPSARDPWVVLQTVPSVFVDRVNVGGAESGQQSNYQAKGASGVENTWSIDGIPITDMSALGSSPSYYDFDMFQEIAITTGGADARSATPGVGLNFVLKSGSNTPHGSSRIYFENESMQANNLPDELRDTLGGQTGKGNRIDEYKDYGFELGGPLFRDRLWVWGAFGKTDVTLLTLANTPDNTQLENYSFKATGQATQALRGSFTYFRGEKLKFGRNAGVSRPPETTWNQGGPTEVFKGEGNVVLGNNTFLTGRYAWVGGGFFLTPQGGLDTKMIFADDDGIGRGSWYDFRTDRPQWTAAVDGNHFRGVHELKFGFSYRKADVDSTTTIPGPDGIATTHDDYPNMIAAVTAWNQNTGTTGKYTSAYVGDTISLDRLTMNLALRWDRQTSSVRSYTQRGNPVLPELLPDLTGAAADDAVVWNSVTPRIGATYALTEDRRTIARGSYAAFASQMNAGQAGFFSTVGSLRGVYFYDVTDLNGNRVVDPEEIAGRTCTVSSPSTDCNWYGFDIENPASTSTNHRIGDYSTPLTHELVFGVDHELFTNFGLSASFTWRRFVNFNWRPLQGIRSDDYVQLGTLAGSHPAIGSYSVPLYGVAEDRIPADRTATEYVDREGYHQRYWGFEVSATKRLSNRWMARVGFSTNDHREYFDSPEAIQDPTPQLLPGPAPLPLNAYPNSDGGPVLTQTSGSGKGGIFMVSPRYQLSATGMYSAAWGINLAANLVSRQGYAMPYQLTQVDTFDPLGNLKAVIVVPDTVGDRRLSAVTSLDFRVGKEFGFNRARLNLDFDVFNVLNANTVLARQYDLSLPSANNVREIMNPRVLRLGARFSF